MSLPTLTTSGAVIVGAWRAEDAVLDEDDYVISIPSLVNSPGADMVSRYYNGSGVSDGPSSLVVINATGVDGGVAIESSGAGGTYTTDPTILSVAEGAGKKYQTFIRCRWNYGERFSGINGFEHWDENQCAYIESGDDGAPDALTQIDRGSGRRQQGTETYASGEWNIESQVDTDGDFEVYANGSASPENVFSFQAPQDEWSAYMTGPLQRTAAATNPPGIWTYTNTIYWSRHVIVATPSGFLNETDRANLIDWVEGTDFDPPDPPDANRRIIRSVRPPDATQRPSHYRLP